MTSRAAIFGNSQEKPEEESEKLLNLYWNRAELKKDLDGLRKEQFRLQDRIKEEEGATARIQQKLGHLESLLLDPEWADNVVTHYQFRALNLRCQGKLEKFAEELKQQREQKRNNQEFSIWNEQREREATDIEHELGERRMVMQSLEDQLQAERDRLMTMSGIMKFFRGRSIAATQEHLALEIEVAQHDEEQLMLQYDEVQERQPPDSIGLDLGTKRLINFTILAFAQQLYLHFSDDELASLAKDSGQKSVGAINFGNKKECDGLIARIQQWAENFENATGFAEVLQQRAKLIGEKAEFYSEDDAVPLPATVATVYAISAGGVTSETSADLLGENYWNLSSILTR